MKIICITNISLDNPYMVEPLYLQEIFRSRGHIFDLINIGALELDNDCVKKISTKLLEYDLVYYRGGSEEYSTSMLLKQLDKIGKIVVNKAALDQPLSRNKRYQMYSAVEFNIAIPKTILSPLFTKRFSFQSLSEKLGTPFIAKASFGSMGKSVFLVHTNEEYFEAMKEIAHDCIFQEYIPHEADYRVLLIGGDIQYTLKRNKAQGEHRANLKVGGTRSEEENMKIKNAVESVAQQAARLFQYDIAGIDCLWDKKRQCAVFVEANYKPQWKNTSEYFGVDIASNIIDYFQSLVSARNK